MEQTEPNRKAERFINYRPLFEIALGLILGIALCGSIKGAGVVIFGSVFAVGGIILFIIKQPRDGLFVFSVAVGALLLLSAAPEIVPRGEYELTGVVSEYAETARGAEITLKNAKLNGKRCKSKIFLKYGGNDYEKIEIGDGIFSYAEVYTARAKFGTYDEFRVLASRGIGAKAKTDSLEVVSRNNAPVLKFLHKIRAAAVDKANAVFKEDGGLIAALTVGERSEIGENRSDIYRTTGTAHLLAISGFHMGVICALMGILLPKGRRWLRFAVMGAGMFIYCLVAVFAPGFVRSAVMTSCILLNSALERRSDSLSGLAVAALILLVINPFQLYSVGFQLSFSACLGIILLNRPVSRFLKKIHFPLAQAVSVTLCASLTASIFQMRYFGNFSPYLLLGNIIAVPAFSIILILSVALTAAGFILPSAASFLAVVPRGVLFVTEKYLSLISNLPGAVMPFHSPPVIACVSILAAAFLISPFTLRPLKKRLKYALIAMAVFTISTVLSIIKL